MYVVQRSEKQHLECESCKEWKDDWFCDWELYSNDKLVICSKCGHREAIRAEKKLIKVRNLKVVYTKTNLGRKDGNKHNKGRRRSRQNSMF